jgi:hypothetical protein
MRFGAFHPRHASAWRLAIDTIALRGGSSRENMVPLSHQKITTFTVLREPLPIRAGSDGRAKEIELPGPFSGNVRRIRARQ